MPRESAPDVAVLGGGVVGITAAIHLELVGYETVVYTDRIPFVDDGGPTLATTYAAASVYPAYVTMSALARVFDHSQAVFSLLADAGSMGVRRQPHFVLAEGNPPISPVHEALDEVVPVGQLTTYPHRSESVDLAGFRFTAYFAETPAYLSRCYALYRSLGGTVHRQTLSLDDVVDLPATVLVNCAGLRAKTLFDDPCPVEAYIGHQVLARDLPPVRGPDGQLFSYSYTVADTAMADRAGLVYAYPRMDALVLGGSYERVDVHPGETWDGAIEGPTVSVDGVAVPARIRTVNAELLAEFAGLELAEADLTARYGYRPVREPAGVRLERESIAGQPVVHNYGHGGAGVTLSWGSAAHVERLVNEIVAPSPTPITLPPALAVGEQMASMLRNASEG